MNKILFIAQANGNTAVGIRPPNIEEIKRIIDNQPTADVREVRHGEWIAKKRGKYKNYFSVCSLCGHQILNDFIKESKYCPNCGAKMQDDSVLTNIYNCEACKKLCCDGCELYEGTNMDSQ